MGYSPWGRKESDATERLRAHSYIPLKTHTFFSDLTSTVTPPKCRPNIPLILQLRFLHKEVIFFQPLFPKDALSWHRI